MWHVDCMFKMGCQFEMNHATTERTCADMCTTTCQRQGNNIWFDLIYFPLNADGLAELSPTLPWTAVMRCVWMTEISSHKITLTQLLHGHTELSQAVDLILWKAFMCHWAEEEEEEGTEKMQAQTELRHIFRNKQWFLMCTDTPLHCANVWHSLIFKLIYSTGQIMVDGDR